MLSVTDKASTIETVDFLKASIILIDFTEWIGLLKK